jgi:ATP-dependent Clp protease adapter protein ClpS
MNIKPLKEYIREAEAVVDAPPELAKPPVGQEKEKSADKPGGFTVMILNDGYTPFEVVLEAISSVTGMSQADAYQKMMRAHQGGWAPIKSYSSKDLAETIAHGIMRHAQQNDRYDHYRQHPHFRNFRGPWPLTAEVMDAAQ